jgi:hypothetical protein
LFAPPSPSLMQIGFVAGAESLPASFAVNSISLATAGVPLERLR